MDSKSISRKGVRVQVPSLAPEPGSSSESAAALDDLVTLLLEHALARIARATRRLRKATHSLGSEVDRSMEGEPGLPTPLDAAEVDRLGWCLGVLAASRGADLLRERREREGLAQFVGFVCEAHGVAVVPDVARLPRLSTTMGRGWEVPLAAGWLFSGVARLRPGGPLAWRFESGEGRARLALETRSSTAQERAALVRAGDSLGIPLPDARWDSVGEDVGFALPRSWFEA